MRSTIAVGFIGVMGLAGALASAGSVPLEMRLYVDVGGELIAPEEQIGVSAGQTVRYVLMAEIGDAPGDNYFDSISIDLVPYDCNGQIEVFSFEYGDWAVSSVPPSIQGGSIIGIEAFQFGFDSSNPVEVCSFEAVAQFGILVYTAQGTGPGGEAFGVGFSESYGADVFSSTRIIAVGSPGNGGPCTGADMAEPYGVLDLADIQGFVQDFSAGDCFADFRPPWAVLDLQDLQAFVSSFLDGCR